MNSLAVFICALVLLGDGVIAYVTPMRLAAPRGLKHDSMRGPGRVMVHTESRIHAVRRGMSSNEDQFGIQDVLVLPANGIVESKWWGAYNRARSSKGLQALLTKSCSSFVGFLLGDFLSQMLTSTSKFNMVRFLRMGTFGALVHAPAGHLFYKNLEKRIPGSSRNAVVQKVIVDQLLWTPLFAALMFSYNGVLAGHNLPTVLEAMKTSKSVVTYMITSLLLWPTAHYINYNAVAPNKRLLFINMIQIFFNTIIAGLAATFCGALP